MRRICWDMGCLPPSTGESTTMRNDSPRPRQSALRSFATAAIVAASLIACGSEKSDPTRDSPPTPVKPAATNAGNGGPAANYAPAGTGAAAATTASLPAQSPTPAAAGPNGRSAVPTVDEWNAAKEVTVKGSTKLNCETKMVREWLRVSCRGKNDTGGEAKNVTIKKGGGRGDTFVLPGNKLASLVCPFVNGTDLVAEFEWTDKKKELVVSWPHGAPEPPSKGEFR
jgi:hypothetical protein